MPQHGEIKQFPNGHIGQWDGQGWEDVTASHTGSIPQSDEGPGWAHTASEFSLPMATGLIGAAAGGPIGTGVGTAFGQGLQDIYDMGMSATGHQGYGGVPTPTEEAKKLATVGGLAGLGDKYLPGIMRAAHKIIPNTPMGRFLSSTALGSAFGHPAVGAVTGAIGEALPHIGNAIDKITAPAESGPLAEHVVGPRFAQLMEKIGLKRPDTVVQPTSQAEKPIDFGEQGPGIKTPPVNGAPRARQATTAQYENYGPAETSAQQNARIKAAAKAQLDQQKAKQAADALATKEVMRDQGNLSDVMKWRAAQDANKAALADIAAQKAGRVPTEPSISTSTTAKGPDGQTQRMSQQFVEPDPIDAALGGPGGKGPQTPGDLDAIRKILGIKADIQAPAVQPQTPEEFMRASGGRAPGGPLKFPQPAPMTQAHPEAVPENLPGQALAVQGPPAQGQIPDESLDLVARSPEFEGTHPLEPNFMEGDFSEAPPEQGQGQLEGFEPAGYLNPRPDTTWGGANRSKPRQASGTQPSLSNTGRMDFIPPTNIPPNPVGPQAPPESAGANPTVSPDVESTQDQSPVAQLLRFFKTKQGATGYNYRQAQQAAQSGEIPTADFAREARLRENVPPPEVQTVEQAPSAPLTDLTPDVQTPEPEDWVKQQSSIVDKLAELARRSGSR